MQGAPPNSPEAVCVDSISDRLPKKRRKKYVSQDEGGNQTEDHSGDQLEPEELESAAYQFVELYREGGEMHERGGCAVLVESMVFTKEKQQALGIPDGTLPVGWWIGFKVTDEDVWSKVKNGTYPMFSIEGTAIREEIEE